MDYTGRCYLLLLQYALGVPPNLRTNIDYVFILRENFVSNRKRLYEHYAGMFPVMIFSPHYGRALRIMNASYPNAESNKLEDQVSGIRHHPIRISYRRL